MIIVLSPDAGEAGLQLVIQRVESLGLRAHCVRGELRTVIGVIGEEEKIRIEPLEAIPGVEKVLPILKPFKLASRELHQQPTVVTVGEHIRIGDGHLGMIAGPCAIESYEVLDAIAREVKAAG